MHRVLAGLRSSAWKQNGVRATVPWAVFQAGGYLSLGKGPEPLGEKSFGLKRELQRAAVSREQLHSWGRAHAHIPGGLSKALPPVQS